MRIILKGANGNVITSKELQPGCEDFKIGRKPTCEILLQCLSISREHLTIRFDNEGRLQIQDLHSTFGTSINGQKIVPGIFVPVQPGTVIQLSEEVFLSVERLKDQTSSPSPEQETMEKWANAAEFFPFFLTKNINFVQKTFSEIRKLVPAENVSRIGLYESEVSDKIHELSAILEVSYALNSILNYQQLLEYTIDMALRVTRAERGCLILFNENRQKFEMVVARRMGNREVKKEMYTSHSLILKCFKTGETMVITDTTAVPDIAEKTSIVLNNIKCVALTPLRYNRSIIGVLYLDSRIAPGIFKEKDQELLKFFAAQASVAINNARLLFMATTDGLTELTNHKSFLQRLLEEFYRAKRYGLRLSLIFVDIDHFKQVNDVHGHPAGDKVLKSIGKILKENVRMHDLPGRYGGEEFVILLPQTELEGAAVLAEKLRSKVETTSFVVSDETKPDITITISAGVAEIDNQTMEKPLSLVQAADKALYMAKKSGRNRVVISRDID